MNDLRIAIWMEKKKPEMQDIPSRLEGDVSESY